MATGGADKFVVYRIRNKLSGTIYFGSTVDFKARMSTHRRELERGVHRNLKLRSDAREFGVDSFEFRIVARCSSLEEVRQREQLYLTIFWGRANCCNRDFLADLKHGPRTYTMITAEHKTFRRTQSKKRAAACTKIKGWGTYLSVHAAARDLGLSKTDISAVIDVPKKYVDDWFFKSEKGQAPEYLARG